MSNITLNSNKKIFYLDTGEEYTDYIAELFQVLGMKVDFIKDTRNDMPAIQDFSDGESVLCFGNDCDKLCVLKSELVQLQVSFKIIWITEKSVLKKCEQSVLHHVDAVIEKPLRLGKLKQVIRKL